ncbi:MAG: hypothetical protein IPM14_14895 [bacterium]|nr:hypothetical protein [bacterium]
MISNRRFLTDKYFLLSWLLAILFLIYSFILALGSMEGTRQRRPEMVSFHI